MNGHSFQRWRRQPALTKGFPMSSSSRQKTQSTSVHGSRDSETAAEATGKAEQDPKSKGAARISKDSKVRARQLEKRVSSAAQHDLLLSTSLRRLTATNAPKDTVMLPLQLTGRARRLLE